MQLRTLFRGADTQTDSTDSPEAEYARWREESAAVTACYRDWLAAPRGERFLAYSAYLSALEQEEQAAEAYRRLAERSLERQ